MYSPAAVQVPEWLQVTLSSTAFCPSTGAPAGIGASIARAQ
jgi:hypothetical protein